MVQEVLVPFASVVDKFGELGVTFVRLGETVPIVELAPDVPKRLRIILKEVLCDEVFKGYQLFLQDGEGAPEAVGSAEEWQLFAVVRFSIDTAVGSHARP